MAEYNKDKFYWLKLKRDFFKRHDIKIIEAMPNGKDYVLFYLKLMVESIDHDGELRFSSTIPYDEKMLSVITDTNIDIVRAAITLLEQLGMIEILDDKTIYMTEVRGLIGSQTFGAEKKQIQFQRRAEKLEGGQKVENLPPEIEIEKEIELDIERDNKYTHAHDDFLPSIPSIQEVKDYITLKSYKVDAQRFMNYYTAKGWKLGNTNIDNWQVLVDNWARQDMIGKRLDTDFKQRTDVGSTKFGTEVADEEI